MIITREKGMRMWGGGSGSTSASGVNGGGGFSLAVEEGEGTGNAYTDFTYESGTLTLNKATEFVTVDFFNKLFTAYDANGNVIAPNNTTPTLGNIKFMAGAWTEQYLSALGQNSSGGGGGGGIELSDVWHSLKTNTDDYANQKINIAHIPDLSGTYATKTWVNQQGFVTSSGVTSVATGTGLTGGTITSTGTISINSTYQTYISNGNTAYGYFSDGVANTAAKLNTGTTTYSVWGQTYWQNGLPKSVSNTYMSGVTNIDSLLYFDTTNSRIGIGTSSPSYKLDVSGDVRSTFYRTTNADGSFGALNSRGSIFCYLDSSLSGGFSTGMYAIDSSGTTLGSAAGIYGDSNGIARYYFGGTYNSPLMSILPSGNVGIGTTSPSYKLHVNGYTSTTRLYLSSSVYLEYDSSNSGVHLVGAGFYSDSYVSALDSNSSGGGSGTFDEEAMWAALGTTITAKKISNNYLNLASWAKASSKPSYTFSEIGSKPTTLSGYGVLDDANGMYYALYGGTDLAPTSTNTINLNDLRSTGSYYVSTNTPSQYVTNKPDDTQNYAFRVWVSAPGGTSNYRRQRFQYLAQMAIYERFYSTDTSTWGSWYLVQDDLTNYALASSLDGYLPLSGGTLTGTLTTPKIRINTRHSSGDTRGGIYYYNGTTDYLLIGQGSANLWIGANETDGTHHTGSTFISAGSGSAYISRLVNSTRGNYLILDSGNYSSYALPLSGGTITGNLAVRGYIYLRDNNKGLYTTDTADNVQNTLYLNDANELLIGHGTAGSGYNTYLHGNNLYIRYGTSRTVGLMLNSSGNVGIGTTTPSYKLHVYGQVGVTTASQGTMRLVSAASINYIQSGNAAFDGNADMIIGGYNATTGTNLNLNFSVVKATSVLKVKEYLTLGYGGIGIYLTSSGINWHNSADTWTKTIMSFASTGATTINGNLTVSGEVTASSDERKKNIISNTKFNVRDIASARSILFEWKDRKDKIHGGSIAQDWLGKADSFLLQDDDGFYSINYGALALCSAITIAREVVKHEDRITLLEKENARLKARVEELEERRIA